MQCLAPVPVFVNGEKIETPCRHCLPCQHNRTQEWAFRCDDEAKVAGYENCCFVTFTYNDNNVPEKDCFDRTDIQLFLKRLRKKHIVRYFGCGELGGRNGRPHYHLVLFGYCPNDGVFYKFSRHGIPLYISKELESFWKKGYCPFSYFSPGCGKYAAKYLNKLQPNREAFTLCSLKPSIGISAILYDDMLRGYTIRQGRKIAIPKSYYASYERNGVLFPETKEKKKQYIVNMTEEEKRRQEKKSEEFSVNLLTKLHL